MSTFSDSTEAVNPLSERQIFMRIIVYGIVLSTFFSLITFLIGFFFRKRMGFNRKYLAKSYLMQVLILLSIYAVFVLRIYFK
jgi:hypothetical protein